MHPTLTPTAAHDGRPGQTQQVTSVEIRPDGDQIRHECTYLESITDLEIRRRFVIGYLETVLADVARHTTNQAAVDAIVRGLAIITAADRLEKLASAFTYDRENAAEEDSVLPTGVEGTVIGRWAK